MNDRIALCINQAGCAEPRLIGLDGEHFENMPWLDVFCSGVEARVKIQATLPREVWVLSCDDIDSINLAAAIKADTPTMRVHLVADEINGSLRSRARVAAIDDVVSKVQFVKEFQEEKRRRMQLQLPVLDENAAVVMPIRFQPEAKRLVKRDGRAFVLPVVGGSGGVGKSTVSVMGALLAEQMGYRTLLVDYDLQFGDAALFLGGKDGLALDEAIGDDALLQNLLDNSTSFAFLTAPARIEMAETVVRDMGRLIERVRGAFDVVIANTGAAWAEQHAVLLEQSSAALFLVDQRSTSLWACKHALDLCVRCGIATGSFLYAVNRCGKNAAYTSIDISCALQGATVYELRDGGRDVEDFLSAGSARELLSQHNEFVESLREMLIRILPNGEAHKQDDGQAKKPSKGRARKLLRIQGGKL